MNIINRTGRGNSHDIRSTTSMCCVADIFTEIRQRWVTGASNLPSDQHEDKEVENHVDCMVTLETQLYFLYQWCCTTYYKHLWQKLNTSFQTSCLALSPKPMCPYWGCKPQLPFLKIKCYQTYPFAAETHLFFSSSSLLAFFLNLGRSCCSSSLAASLSLSAVLSLEKWNVVLSPVCRTSWSWILALPSGLIFWPVQKKTSNA